jgi:hypothetical protein
MQEICMSGPTRDSRPPNAGTFCPSSIARTLSITVELLYWPVLTAGNPGGDGSDISEF